MIIKGTVLIAALALSAVAMADGSHQVDGYTKRDGTYVPPHQATNPNDTKTDNWSSRGNVNPTNGKEGTKDPYAPKKPKY